ncbi:hypothetical protein Tdes44962_MAKER01345 [Teratosphaeria destructans]|uniref:Uncharacterized protein n=1 Tax=Teratosphaeria destructans TaxID=418781 RepID=A0A9W7T060_9PEZI|nr:hypothetical protein Tdes44962_MAKER01345 [Teratosphaeria destructans]
MPFIPPGAFLPMPRAAPAPEPENAYRGGDFESVLSCAGVPHTGHTYHHATTPSSHVQQYPVNQEKKKKYRRYKNHYCGWRGCPRHYILSKWFGEPDEQLIVDDIEHLPVCHYRCWKAELDRFWAEVSPEDVDLILHCGLRLCHRVCYLTDVKQLQDCERDVPQAVPELRTWKEWMRIPKWQHQISVISCISLEHCRLL